MNYKLYLQVSECTYTAKYVERTTKRGSELNILYAVEIDFHFIKYLGYTYRWNCKRKST